MNKQTEPQASPVFGLRYLEDREVEGLDVVGCLITRGDGTATGCDDHDEIVLVYNKRAAGALGGTLRLPSSLVDESNSE